MDGEKISQAIALGEDLILRDRKCRHDLRDGIEKAGEFRNPTERLQFLIADLLVGPTTLAVFIAWSSWRQWSIEHPRQSFIGRTLRERLRVGDVENFSFDGIGADFV